MDMSGMDMTPTATAAGAAATASAAMSGMDMGGGCKISMLWNWTVIDACFLGSDWHIRTRGGFAGSIFGVFFLALAIEAVRRAHREYDKRLIAHHRQLRSHLAQPASAASSSPMVKGDSSSEAAEQTPTLLQGATSGRAAGPTMGQQAIRAIFFGLQFSGAFTLMLIGMYFNGYMVLTIYFGMAVGYFLFAGDTLFAAEPVVAGCGC